MAISGLSVIVADGYMRIVHFWCRRCPMNFVPTVSDRLILALTLDFCGGVSSVVLPIRCHCINHNSDYSIKFCILIIVVNFTNTLHQITIIFYDVHRLAVLVNFCKVVKYSACAIIGQYLHLAVYGAAR